MNILLFFVLLAVSCSYAGIRGGQPERAAAAIIVAATAATVIVTNVHFHGFAGVEHGIVAVDALTFAGLMVLTLRANRFWPMAMTACVATGLLAHAAMILSPKIMPQVYAMFHAFSAYPVMLILIVGTLRHRARLKASGIDRSWSSSFT